MFGLVISSWSLQEAGMSLLWKCSCNLERTPTSRAAYCRAPWWNPSHFDAASTVLRQALEKSGKNCQVAGRCWCQCECATDGRRRNSFAPVHIRVQCRRSGTSAEIEGRSKHHIRRWWWWHCQRSSRVRSEKTSVRALKTRDVLWRPLALKKSSCNA